MLTDDMKAVFSPLRVSLLFAGFGLCLSELQQIFYYIWLGLPHVALAFWYYARAKKPIAPYLLIFNFVFWLLWLCFLSGLIPYGGLTAFATFCFMWHFWRDEIYLHRQKYTWPLAILGILSAVFVAATMVEKFFLTPLKTPLAVIAVLTLVASSRWYLKRQLSLFFFVTFLILSGTYFLNDYYALGRVIGFVIVFHFINWYFEKGITQAPFRNEVLVAHFLSAVLLWMYLKIASVELVLAPVCSPGGFFCLSTAHVIASSLNRSSPFWRPALS